MRRRVRGIRVHRVVPLLSAAPALVGGLFFSNTSLLYFDGLETVANSEEGPCGNVEGSTQRSVKLLNAFGKNFVGPGATAIEPPATRAKPGCWWACIRNLFGRCNDGYVPYAEENYEPKVMPKLLPLKRQRKEMTVELLRRLDHMPKKAIDRCRSGAVEQQSNILESFLRQCWPDGCSSENFRKVVEYAVYKANQKYSNLFSGVALDNALSRFEQAYNNKTPAKAFTQPAARSLDVVDGFLPRSLPRQSSSDGPYRMADSGPPPSDENNNRKTSGVLKKRPSSAASKAGGVSRHGSALGGGAYSTVDGRMHHGRNATRKQETATNNHSGNNQSAQREFASLGPHAGQQTLLNGGTRGGPQFVSNGGQLSRGGSSKSSSNRGALNLPTPSTYFNFDVPPTQQREFPQAAIMNAKLGIVSLRGSSEPPAAQQPEYFQLGHRNNALGGGHSNAIRTTEHRWEWHSNGIGTTLNRRRDVVGH